MNSTFIAMLLIISITSALYVAVDEPEDKTVEVNIKTKDTVDDTIINKEGYNTIPYDVEVGNAYTESRLEINCDKILNKVETTEHDIKHIWQERAKRLQC